jgi:hypothetical protein
MMTEEMAQYLEQSRLYCLQRQQQAQAAGDTFSALLLTERPLRPRLLLSLLQQGRVEDPEESIQEWWTDTEFPSQQKQTWRKIFRFLPRNCRNTEPVEVWRGGLTWRGFSWTRDQDKAKWFAQRFNAIRSGNLVWHARVNPQRILFETNDRNESEAVVEYWYKDTFLQRDWR